MDRKIFHRLFEERIVMLDGATGSNLMQAGMPVGVSVSYTHLTLPTNREV